KRNPGKENINQKILPYCFLMLIGTACGSWLALVQVVILTIGTKAYYRTEAKSFLLFMFASLQPAI
ncbi:hypothetical protein DSA70_25120, partial [Salmonella enterica subsp. enterica]|nr:hypothetical protein [Salmonella enterica subsp. enterica]